jgi:hypothetical protein
MRPFLCEHNSNMDKIITKNLLKDHTCQNCELFYSIGSCPNSSLIKRQRDFDSVMFSCEQWHEDRGDGLSWLF